MDNLDEHIREAREKLEAAEHSLEAARKAHAASQSSATAGFLQDAQLAYDQARSAYELAVGAKQGHGGA
jgi:hypothetical protein